MKKADNIFVRAKAYRKEHPRTSFQDAIKKVAGKKVSGPVKKRAAASKKTAVTPGRTRSAVSGTRKRVTAKKVASSTPKISKKEELLRAYMRIDEYETQLKNEKRAAYKKELIE